MKYKNPKIEKIYEAISVLADSRIVYKGANSAMVYSSDKSKYYTLIWNNESSAFYSDDNASKWQSTLGYPIIAILLDKEIIPLHLKNTQLFADINWNQLNKEHKRNYGKVVEIILKDRYPVEEDRNAVIKTIEDTYMALTALHIEKSTSKNLET